MMIELAQAALKKLEIDFSGRIYRHLGDIGMVWSLNEIRTIEDKKLLSGHVAMILGDYNLAANLYLQSGKNFLDTKTEGMCKPHYNNQDLSPLANGIYFIVITNKPPLHN